MDTNIMVLGFTNKKMLSCSLPPYIDDLKPRLLQLGALDVLIPLTDSSSVEVQGNSAAAIGNLSSKVQDYQPFISVWDAPSGGLHGYLSRFLESVDTTFQHIAIWTIVQFLEGDDSELIELITRSPEIIPAVRQLTQSLDSTSPHQQDGDNMMNDESEIVGLARRVISMLSQTD